MFADVRRVGRPSEPNPPLLSPGTAKSNAVNTQFPFVCTEQANRTHARPAHSPQTICDHREIPNTVSLAVLDRDRQQLISGPSNAPMLVGNHVTEGIGYGCVWDPPNYSCAHGSEFMVTFSAYRYANSSRRQGCWPAMRRLVVSSITYSRQHRYLYYVGGFLPFSIHTGTGFATTSAQSTPLTSPAFSRTRLLSPTSLSIRAVLRETVPWFPSSSLATMNNINLRPRSAMLPSSCLCIC